MARTVAAGMAAAIAETRGSLIHFLELQFSAGTQRITTAPDDVAWNSVTWSGVGGVLTFGDVTESGDTNAHSLDVTLAGVSQTLITVLLTQKYLGRAVKLYHGHLDPVLQTVIADPLLLFQGMMNGGWTIRETRPDGGMGTCEIVGRFMDRLTELERRAGIQANSASLQAFHPGDRFFEAVPQYMNRPLTWKR